MSRWRRDQAENMQLEAASAVQVAMLLDQHVIDQWPLERAPGWSWRAVCAKADQNESLGAWTGGVTPT